MPDIQDIMKLPREQRAAQARRHADYMRTRYAKEIKSSAQGAALCDRTRGIKPDPREPSGTRPDIVLLACNTADAIRKYADLHGTARVCALNYASFTRCGGGFLTGAMAQEEALCHESDLYPILAKFEKPFYGRNRELTDDGLYADRMLWTPDVIFVSDGQDDAMCDILTCAAPNRRRSRATDAENERVLDRRIKTMFRVLEDMRANGANTGTFITGAWGCGVFGQDPAQVADLFLRHAIEFRGNRIVFAIPDAHGPNYKAFKTAIETYERRRNHT